MQAQFGTNTNEQRMKRVYYTETSTIYEGMPVCYEYDATTNILGYSDSSAAKGSTTAEGYQNEGKYLRVENPNLVLTIVGTITGTFVVGETVTQASTGATGKVDVANTGATTVYIRPVTGTFTVSANTITGGTSGATLANPSAITVSTANLQWFAGVVASSTFAGKTGPRWLDIFVANGAIVPVRKAAIATVTGRTILAINSATQTFGNPKSDIPDYEVTAGNIDARSVAVAEETTSAAIGLCLARVNPEMFIYQGGQVGQELQVAAGTVNTVVNKVSIDFKTTSGRCCVSDYRGIISGAGGDCLHGMYRFTTILSGAVTELGNTCLHTKMEIRTASDAAISLHSVFGIKISFQATANAKLDGTSILAPLMFDWNLSADGTNPLSNPPAAGAHTAMIYCNVNVAGTTPNFFIVGSPEALAIQTTKHLDGTNLCARMMKINMGGPGSYYIPVYHPDECTG